MRGARLLWLALVLLGLLFVLGAIALDIAALVLPKWVRWDFSAAAGLSSMSRGLFSSCTGGHCVDVSGIIKDGEQQCTTCNTGNAQIKYYSIISLRLSSWALHVVALAIEGFTAFGCMFYLAKVRCCTESPSAQKAQTCLSASGFLLWTAAIFATIGNIVFSYGLTTEKIYSGDGLNAVYASQSATWQSGAAETFDTSIIFTWLSICLAFTASWLWLSAAYVQTPAHVSFNPTSITISQTPLFSTTKSLART